MSESKADYSMRVFKMVEQASRLIQSSIPPDSTRIMTELNP